MTKLRWGPALLPRLRGELVRDARRVVDRMSVLAPIGAQRDLAGLREAAQIAADQLDEAELIWVAKDMATTALDASLDIPLVDPELAPWPAGLIVFERPLPPLPPPGPLTLLDGTQWSDPLPVDAVTWYFAGPYMHLTRYCRRGAFTDAGVQDGELQEVAGLKFHRDRALDLAAADQDLTRIKGHRVDDLRVLATLAAAWVLMFTPTVADRSTLDPANSAITRPAPSGEAADAISNPGLITLVDLRPMRHVSVERGASGRVYQHRWVVRGHWRQQHYGPKASLRRPTWIESYIKGPADAPLMAAEKVMVWRR